MRENDIPADSTKSISIAAVRLEIGGSGYYSELENEVRKELSEDYIVYTRGSRGPAAGPELLLNLVVEFFNAAGELIADELVGALIGAALERLIIKVSDSVRHGAEKCSKLYCRDGFPPPPDGYLASITAVLPTFDLVVHLVPDGDSGVERYNYSKLVERVNSFVCQEASKGCSVVKVSLPCEIVCDGNKRIVQEGHGSPNLWHVEYGEGVRWPSAVYDDSQEAFLPDVN